MAPAKVLMITMGARQSTGLFISSINRETGLGIYHVLIVGAVILATLIGLTILTHQIGCFLGAWLGGLTMAHDGSYL